MSQIKVYIAPFDNEGLYQSFIDITEDVDRSIGSITKKFDNSEFNLGTFRSSDIGLTLRNEHGHYSDIDGIETIFKYKRSGSKIKITWQIENDDVECGIAICGSSLISEEIVIFEGLLNDESTKEDLFSRTINFTALSYESIFNDVVVDITTFDNADTIEEVLYKILNVSSVTGLLTLSASNISVDSNVAIDDKTDFENDKLNDTLKSLLTVGNSVLYISDSVIYITPRTASSTLQKTFYGQASDLGIEDVVNLGKISSGLNRTINFASWNDYATTQSDASSVSKYGAKTKELNYAFITNSTSKDTILAAIIAEFKTPEKELTLTANIGYETLSLGMLDKINIDYPTPLFVAEGDTFPLYGVAVYGVDYYPFAEYSTVLTTDIYFKIIGIKINLNNDTINFNIRGI